jgi:hypothetical protein
VRVVLVWLALCIALPQLPAAARAWSGGACACTDHPPGSAPDHCVCPHCSTVRFDCGGDVPVYVEPLGATVGADLIRDAVRVAVLPPPIRSGRTSEPPPLPPPIA